MLKIESEVVKANYSSTEVFRVLSDLRNLELLKDKVPQDKISDLKFDRDTCQFSVSPLGAPMTVGVKIVEREECKTVKFGADGSPVDFNFWIQMKEVGDNDTRIKLTVKSDMNMFLEGMIKPKLQPMLDKLAGVLASLPYRNFPEINH